MIVFITPVKPPALPISFKVQLIAVKAHGLALPGRLRRISASLQSSCGDMLFNVALSVQ